MASIVNLKPHAAAGIGLDAKATRVRNKSDIVMYQEQKTGREIIPLVELVPIFVELHLSAHPSFVEAFVVRFQEPLQMLC